MGKREQQKQQTRQTILRAAYEVFARDGIAGARMDDVAVAAGVSHGTVFAHFATQEALVVCVVEQFGQAMRERTHELARESGGLDAILRAHLQSLREREEFATRLIGEMAVLPQTARDVWVGSQSVLSLHFCAALRGLSAAPTRPEPHFLFNLWMGLVQYYLLNRDLFAPGGSVLERCGEQLVEQYLRLVAPEKEGNAL